MVIIVTVMTRIPGSRSWMYSRGDPARAPPNRYVKISTNMIGKAVTSNSCIGTWRILSIARQANVIEAPRAEARGGRARVDSAARSVASATAGAPAGTVVVVVVVVA